MRAYIIILQESDHSRSIGSDSIKEANKFGIYPEVFNAVNGYQSAKVFEKHGITRFLTSDIIEQPGHQGCFLSHFELWMKCVELDEPIIILEHDGVFIRELPDNILEKFDGVLKLDPLLPYNGFSTYNYKVKKSLTLNNPIEVWDQPAKGKWYGVGEFVWGAYGYIIKPKAAASLIDFAQRIGACPTDVHIGRNLVDIKTTIDPVVRLHEFYNDHTVRKESTTSKLEKFVVGKNQLAGKKRFTKEEYEQLVSDYSKEKEIK
jgi:GR25 family glycosyltransferase involved in LPS biosynthesis